MAVFEYFLPMVDGVAALLARFGSELADDRLLLLAILKDAGMLTAEQIARRAGFELSAVESVLERLVLAKFVTQCELDGVYQAGGQYFSDLIEFLSSAEPAPRRS